MDMEARSVGAEAGRELLVKLKEYKADLAKLKEDLRAQSVAGRLRPLCIAFRLRSACGSLIGPPDRHLFWLGNSQRMTRQQTAVDIVALYICTPRVCRCRGQWPVPTVPLVAVSRCV